MISRHDSDGIIPILAINRIQTDGTTRKALFHYFKANRHRGFAVSLLKEFIALRKTDYEASGEDLMFASLLLGFHGHIEDCLVLWEAKMTDFDMYCMFDTTLILFGGIKETIQFLEKQDSKEAKDALEFISPIYQAGNFNDIEEYYNNPEPWFV